MMNQAINRETIEDNHEEHEIGLLLPAETTDQNLTAAVALSVTAPNSIPADRIVDLETGVALSPIRPNRPTSDAASKAFQGCSIATMCCLSVLFTAIVAELKGEEPNTTLIMTLVGLIGSGFFGGLLGAISIAATEAISSNTKQRLCKYSTMNAMLWIATLCLSALTYAASYDDLGFSPQWTGGFAIGTIAVEMSFTMWSMLIALLEPRTKRSTFGQRASSTQFQPAAVLSPINASDDLVQTHALAERTPLLGQQS